MSVSTSSMFYRTRKDREDYFGTRYFKVDRNSDTCLQVVINPGEVKKGKSNTIGIYFISAMTFYGNYFSMNYVEQITYAQFLKGFTSVNNMLTISANK